VSGVPLPDVAYAAALAALPDMTPAQLSRLLGDGSAKDLYERVAAGDGSLVEALVAMGRRRPGGAPGAVGSPRGVRDVPPEPPVGHRSRAMPLFGSASEMERRSHAVLGRLSSWREELGRRPAEDVWNGLVGRGITVVRRGDPEYPPRLLRADFPPELLYVKGSLSRAAAPTVAIVGTRRATHYGMEIAGEMGRALAERDISVVSGLARGIDAAAHVGFLSAGERAVGPVGAVGGGVDVVYPAENRRLWEAVSEAGAIVSEAPLGAPPEGWRFPLRNRIIAALSQVVVIVESSRQGGAMHTVQAADSIGVPVLAVPGSVRSPQSEGTNAIIGEGGASLAVDVYDILTALSLVSLEEGMKVTFSPLRPAAAAGPPSPGRRARRPASVTDDELIRRQVLASCTDDERTVYGALEHTPTTFDIVCARTHHDVGAVALALDHLEELGLARSVGPSWQRV
jgi:DNA protecting protein DprA